MREKQCDYSLVTGIFVSKFFKAGEMKAVYIVMPTAVLDTLV